MIKYILKCSNKHEFESWFSNSKEFEKLKNKKLIECIFCNSQNNVVKSIMLDSVMISAVKKGFNIQDFIHYVKHDTSFYQGFKNLRFYEHDFNSRLEVLDEDSTEIGTINIVVGRC